MKGAFSLRRSWWHTVPSKQDSGHDPLMKPDCEMLHLFVCFFFLKSYFAV